MHVPKPSLPQMLTKLRLWLASDQEIATRLSVPVDYIAKWMAGGCSPTLRVLHIVEANYENECNEHTHSLLRDLKQWRYPDKEIAFSVGVSRSAVSHWWRGVIPMLEHLLALEQLHVRARSELVQLARVHGTPRDLFALWSDKLAFEFLCSIALEHDADHVAKAMVVLMQAKAVMLDPVHLQDGFPFVLDVDFADLPATVRAHAYVHRRGPKLVFRVLLNSRDPRHRQQQTLISEIAAHVFKQFPSPAPATPSPSSALKDKRQRGPR